MMMVFWKVCDPLFGWRFAVIEKLQGSWSCGPLGYGAGAPGGVRDRADGPFAFLSRLCRLELFSSFILRRVCRHRLQLTSGIATQFGSLSETSKPQPRLTMTFSAWQCLVNAPSNLPRSFKFPDPDWPNIFPKHNKNRVKPTRQTGYQSSLSFLSQLIYSSLQRQCFRNKLPYATRHTEVSMQAVSPSTTFSPS